MYYIAVCDDDKRIGEYIENIVTVQDGASSCPALPNKKHRRFLRCEIWCEKLFTSQLDTAFHARFPAVLNSYKILF